MRKFIVITALFFSLTASLHSQWIKQNWPAGTINGFKFFDQNTGIVALGENPSFYVYKTTNSGYNWFEIGRMKSYSGETQLLDSMVMYIAGEDLNTGYDKLYKTIDRGITWDSSISFGLNSISSFYFLSRDTGWVEIFNGGNTTLYKTTNGGLNFQEVNLIATGFPSVYVLYFLKEQCNGYYHGYRSRVDYIEKTTNSGLNWFQLPLLPANINNNPEITYEIKQIAFINKDTGWVSNGNTNIYKTTNGGSNWIIQLTPPIPNIIWNGFQDFFIINKDTIYSDYGSMSFGNNVFKGIIYKTTNGGNNWGYQLPDTSFNKDYGFPFFLNSNTGWFTNIKTTNGGGPIIYTKIKNITVEHPEEFKLIQNYPNPFNPSTTIEFYLSQRANVNLSIYDISGKKVFTIINNFQLVNGYHSYRIDDFISLGLSSGAYFCRIEAYDIRNNTVLFTNTKKMLYIK